MNALRFAIALAVCAAPAAAQTDVYVQPMAANGGTLRPSQLWIDPSGQNDLDSDAIAWEDFQLPQDTLVTRVRWWGEAAPALGFTLSFFNQDPNTIACQPDMFAAGSGPISEELHTSFSQTWAGGALYQFEVDLLTPLQFSANTRYFVSVVGQQPIPWAYWQWAASSSGPNGTFWWQRGAHMYFNLPESRAMSLAGFVGSPLSIPFCFGDGTSGPCPCGNSGAAGAGCANSTGAGALLAASGSASVAADDLVLTTTGLPPSQSGVIFMSASVNQGATFGDGRRCVVGQIARFAVHNSGASGTLSYGPGLAAFSQANFGGANQIGAGQTFGFQAWYRDPAGPCAGNTNLSNGQRVVFVP